MEIQKGKSFKKSEVIELWTGLTDNLPIKPCPIEYKHEGTTIDEDGIRLCGSKPFILSVISRLKDLLKYENGETRLGIAFSEVVDKETGCVMEGRFRCSIQVHERGPQAQMCNAFLAGIKRQETQQANPAQTI